MLKALRLQIPNSVLLGNTNHARLVCDLADAGNRHAINSSWQARGIVGMNSKQQLKILAAVQSQGQRIKRTASAQFRYVLINRSLCGLDQRADVAFATQVCEVRRQTVANVDHCAGQTLFAEDNTPADARVWTKVAEKERLDCAFV